MIKLFYIAFFFIFIISSVHCQSGNENNTDSCIELCKNYTNCYKCYQVENVVNCINCRNVTNSTNCNNCTNVVNCTNCTNVENVENSVNILNSTEIYYSSNVTLAEQCYNCHNVHTAFDCEFCRNCSECLKCHDCEGYRCKHTQGCRNSFYKYKKWAPNKVDGYAWKCTNPMFSEYNFGRNGYKRPPFLEYSKNNTNLTFCYNYEGERSCCDQNTTDHIRKIFENYKDSLSKRTSKRMESIFSEFEQWKNVNLKNEFFSKAQEMKIEEAWRKKLREIKEEVLKLGKGMSRCSDRVLKHLASILCLGCLPDYEWQKFLYLNSTKYIEQVPNFDPYSSPNSTINMDLILSPSIFVGREACEDLYADCKQVFDTFHAMQNRSSQLLRDYMEAISKALPGKPDGKLMAGNLSNITGYEIEYVDMEVDLASPKDLGPVKNIPSQSIQNFRGQIFLIGAKYPYDPNNYFNFEPSLEDSPSIPFTSELCKLVTGGECLMCSRENVKECEFTKGTKFQILANNLAKKIEEVTNNQYREFSAFFFEARRVNLTYNEGGESFTRHFLLPPFREGEFRMKLESKSFIAKKRFFEELDKSIIRSYLIILEIQESNYELGLWHDEFWTNFAYGQSMRQARNIFQLMNNKRNLRSLEFSCKKSGECELSDENGKVLEKSSGFKSYCEECHFSNAEIYAKCEPYIVNTQKLSSIVGLTPDDVTKIIHEDLGMRDTTGCIVCISILDEEPTEDPMEKCYAKAYYPFSGLKNEDSEYSVEDIFLEKNEEVFEYISKLWDINGKSHKKWKLYDITEWFYKMPLSMNYSIANGKMIENVDIPHPSQLLNFNYSPPCDVSFPIYDCKNWICAVATQDFLPAKKIAYNPQDSSDAEYESINSDLHGVFNEELVHEYRKWKVFSGENYTRDNMTQWEFELGSLDPNENFTFFDVGSRGLGSAKESDTLIPVFGITETTNLKDLVEKIEENFAVRNCFLYSISIIYLILS